MSLLALLTIAVIVAVLLASTAGRAVTHRSKGRGARRRRAEHNEMRDPGRERRAEQRARELLRSCVNDEEWAMYRDLGFIRVRGAPTPGVLMAADEPSATDRDGLGAGPEREGRSRGTGAEEGGRGGPGRAEGDGERAPGRASGRRRADGHEVGRLGRRRSDQRDAGGLAGRPSDQRDGDSGPPVRRARPSVGTDDAYAYLIYPHKPIVAYVPSTRRLLNEYCVEFPDLSLTIAGSRLPDSDDVLAKWMALTGDEERLIRKANMHLPGRQIDPGRVRRDLWRLAEWQRERESRGPLEQRPR